MSFKLVCGWKPFSGMINEKPQEDKTRGQGNGADQCKEGKRAEIFGLHLFLKLLGG